MSNSIAKDFRFFSLLNFALPTMAMMVFMSLYTIVDGIFVSRLVGSRALSSVNIVYPLLSLVIAVGVMFSSGGSALIAKKIGQGKSQEAREDFSMLFVVGLFVGVFFMIVGNVFIKEIVTALGATPILLEDSMNYMSILLYFAPACILQLYFQTFFVTAGKPGFGLFLTILGGAINIIADYILMGPMNMGVTGAALGTGMGQTIPALLGLVYFFFVKGSLHLCRPRFRLGSLTKSCTNGSSEMVTNISTAVVTYLFNIVMLKHLGEDGVAAITIVLYGQFLFNALYMGFSMGVAPVISYNYGLNNKDMLARIFKICIGFVTVTSIIVTALALISSPVIVEVFTPKETSTYEIAREGFFLFSFNYIFAGLNIFASSMFTAFSDGAVSAGISFARTFLFIVINILLLPYFLGVTGIWLAVPAAELMSGFLSCYFFITRRKKYHYC